MVKKRRYTHRKGKIVPIEHGNIADEIDHNLGGTPLSPYKAKRRK